MEQDNFARENNLNRWAEISENDSAAQEFDSRRAEANVREAKMEARRDEFQEALNDGASKAEILREILRPVDKLVESFPKIEGYDSFKKACEVRFDFDRAAMSEKHYKRLLAVETGAGFFEAERMTSNDYERFVEQFPTYAEFEEGTAEQKSGEDIFNEMKQNIAVKNPRTGEIDWGASSKKREEYQVDFDRFKTLMFGDQVAAWNALEDTELNDRSDAADTVGVGGNGEMIGADIEAVAEEMVPIGADLGNGYINASVCGFATKAKAYEQKLDGEDVVYHDQDGKWYIAIRK